VIRQRENYEDLIRGEEIPDFLKNNARCQSSNDK